MFDMVPGAISYSEAACRAQRPPAATSAAAGALLLAARELHWRVALLSSLPSSSNPKGSPNG